MPSVRLIPGRQWVFRPPPWAAAVTLVVVGLFVALGNWQLDRAAEKRTLLSQRASWGRSTPLAVTELGDATNVARYRPVVAQGRYLGNKQILLDNQIRHGKAGYRVLTPLAVTGWPWVLLVDRGWIAASAHRARMPELSVPEVAVRLEGVLDLPPSTALRLGDSVVAKAGWPLVLVDFDREAVERRLQATVFPWVLRLRSGEPGALSEPQPAVRRFGPERHLSYAVQWFGLAVAVMIVFVVVNLERDHGNG